MGLMITPDYTSVRKYASAGGRVSEPSQQMWRALESLLAQRLGGARSSVVVAADSEEEGLLVVGDGDKCCQK